MSATIQDLQRAIFGIVAITIFAVLMATNASPVLALDFSTKTMAQFSEAAYMVVKKKHRKKYVPRGYTLLGVYRDKSGVDASLFEHKASGSIALAFAGTQPSDPRDLLADMGIVKKEANYALCYLLDEMVDKTKGIPKVAKGAAKKLCRPFGK